MCGCCLSVGVGDYGFLTDWFWFDLYCVLVWWVVFWICVGLVGGVGFVVFRLLVTSVIFCDYGWFGGGLWWFSGG